MPAAEKISHGSLSDPQRSWRSLLGDPEDLIIELGEFFEVRSDDLGFYHQIFIDSELGKPLFQSRTRWRAAELFGKKFHAAVCG